MAAECEAQVFRRRVVARFFLLNFFNIGISYRQDISRVKYGCVKKRGSTRQN